MKKKLRPKENEENDCLQQYCWVDLGLESHACHIIHVNNEHKSFLTPVA